LSKEGTDINNIVNGCRNGNRQAQELLYKSFYRVMMNFCLRYTKNEMDAMEVLNSGFYKVFKNIHQYDPDKASLYTWIRTIIINNCLDFIRVKEKNIKAEELDKAEEIELEPEIISKMKSVDLLEMIRQLPTATQTVFNLYVIEGYTHKEIGQRVGISEGTSKWHLSEARKILKQLIQE